MDDKDFIAGVISSAGLEPILDFWLVDQFGVRSFHIKELSAKWINLHCPMFYRLLSGDQTLTCAVRVRVKRFGKAARCRNLVLDEPVPVAKEEAIAVAKILQVVPDAEKIWLPPPGGNNWKIVYG